MMENKKDNNQKVKKPKFQIPDSKFQIPIKILLYYSVIFSTILIIGGFYTARSGKEIVSNFLFLPMVVFLWITLIQHRKEVKKLKGQKITKKQFS